MKQPRKAPRALFADQAAQVLAAAPDARARAIVWLMLGCALRCCEVANLQVADYDPRARTLFIVGKGGHERVLPVPDDVARALDDYRAEVGIRWGPFLRSEVRPTAGLTPDTISGYVADWMDAAGVKGRARDGVSAHALRHTAASDVLERCGNVRVVQGMLGHALLSTTGIYLRSAGLGEMRAAMEGRRYEPAVAHSSRSTLDAGNRTGESV